VEASWQGMNAVVDTNVIVYYLLNTEPHVEECRKFWRRINEVSAPASWQAEIQSVLWMAVKTKVIASEDTVTKLNAAARLGIQAVPVRQLWRGALRPSLDSAISPYHILFLHPPIPPTPQL